MNKHKTSRTEAVGRLLGCSVAALVFVVSPLRAAQTDISSTPIQSQIVYDSFRNLLEDKASRPKRLALVVGHSTGRMQARRLLAGRDESRIFECENEALRWLLGRTT